MMPRASWSEPLIRDRRRKRWMAALDLGTIAALVIFAAIVAVTIGHAALLTLLNLTAPGLPAGCC